GVTAPRAGSLPVGVLASGSGTNLQALLDAPDVDVVAVASDKPGAGALGRARAAGVPAAVFPRDDFGDRSARDAAVADWLGERGVGLVVLAGYMQLVSPAFLAAFPQRVINVHPALLPAFPGIDAVGQALDYGAKVTGVTVHFVDEGVDTGPIILQRALDVGDAADRETLHDRLRPLEHELLPEAVRLIAAGRVAFDAANQRRVIVS
ncbi:MAG TPA: phosphoribosylglycinamide formyltransferase, partial [Solirubrobacteraceae bacterium]|nr:phosphoribosylglycinamide formyltransferase [Solirubrobacteraceae bacterium]